MKRKFIEGQSAKIMEAFQEPKTMLQVSFETGIDRANICWEVHELRENDSIRRIKRGCCPISGARASFYTTNPNGWQHLVTRTRPMWEKLDNDTIVMVWEAIKEYYQHQYDGASITIPEPIRELWNTEIKPTIDSQVL